MSKKSLLAVVLISIFLCPAAFAQRPAGFWQNPVIKGAGSIHPLPNAAFQPDKATTYKALFVIDNAGGDPKRVNYGFKYVALTVNVFASAGVSVNHLKFVVVVRGAVPIVLSNVQYKKKFHVDNPNLKLIHELEAAGVQVVVCGQAIAGYNYNYNWIDPSVKVALSGLSTIIMLQQKGYALMEL